MMKTLMSSLLVFCSIYVSCYAHPIKSNVSSRISDSVGKLPYDAEIEYLESDGNAYIILPVKCGSDLDFVCSVAFRTNTYGYIFGGYNGWSQTSPASRYSCRLPYNLNNHYSGRMSLRIGPFAGQPDKNVEEYYVYIDKNVWQMFSFSQTDFKLSMKNYAETFEWTIDSSNKQDVPYKQGTMSMCLFACTSYRSPGYRPSKIAIAYFKAFCKNEIVCDLVPVRIGEDIAAVGYMYDKVGKRLIGNAGNGKFILGPDI